MDPVTALRSASGRTQRAFARAVGTSQPAVAHYERATKSPTWRVVERMAAGIGMECTPHVGVPMTREERRSLHLHRAVATRLHADEEAVVARTRRNLTRLRAAHPHALDLLGEWDAILAGDAVSIAARMLDPSERGRSLRQVTPFAGVLDAAERAEVYRRFRAAS